MHKLKTNSNLSDKSGKATRTINWHEIGIDLAQIYRQDVDIFAPCTLGER